MTRKQTFLGLGLLLLVCLAIGVAWTLRTEPPTANPWWAGKDAKVRIEVWEPGKEMATFAATFPKGTVDAMVALGMKAKIEVGHYDVDMREHWRKVQSLPPGEKLTIPDDEATIYIWIETPDMKAPPVRPGAAESTATFGT